MNKSDELVIYLVRHGQTFFNMTDQAQGSCDTPLTETGILQAERVGSGLADIAFTTVFTGEPGRQRKTAQLILAQNHHTVPAVIECAGFNEWNFGGYEGKMNEEMWGPLFEEAGVAFNTCMSEFRKVMEYFGGNDGVVNAIAKNDPLGVAENYDQILARAKEGMDYLVKESMAAGGGNVLVVSSGGMIPSILDFAAPGIFDGVEELGNCSVTVLKYKDGVYTVEKIGDTSYLKEIG